MWLGKRVMPAESDGGEFLPPLPPPEWRALLRTRLNVLLTGPSDTVQTFVCAARSELMEPVYQTSGAAPDCPDGTRTVILKDIDTLDTDGQLRLLLWLDIQRSRRVQVVSVASPRLISRRAAGAFDATLFYRLNTIYFPFDTANWSRTRIPSDGVGESGREHHAVRRRHGASK